MRNAGEKYWETTLLGAPGREGERYVLAGGEYVYRDGILRQSALHSRTQSQTKDAFGFKWARRETYESGAVQTSGRKWLVDRYFGGDASRAAEYFPGGSRVLDAGCGSGYSALLLLGEAIRELHYLGVDISTAVDVARTRFAEAGLEADFIQADFTRLPFRGPTFDVIIAEGTLHHTDSTRNAIAALSALLYPGGRFLFYVYRKKGPIREFTDDYIRERLRELDDESAWRALMPLTRLGEALGRLDVKVEVPEDVELLDIPAGEIDIQRLFYWHVFKAFYRPDFTLDEMNHINFDWYRPSNAFRQTPDEVREWCQECGLAIEHMGVEEAGITVVARRA